MRQSPGTSFEHAQNLAAGISDLRAHLRATTGEIRARYCQVRAICGDLRVAKIVPRKSHALRLTRKGVTGPLPPDAMHMDC